MLVCPKSSSHKYSSDLKFVLWVHWTIYANVGARSGNFPFVRSSPSCVLGSVDSLANKVVVCSVLV